MLNRLTFVVMVQVVYCCLLVVGCKGTSRPPERESSTQLGHIQRGNHPIADAHWDGRSGISFDIKCREDPLQRWLVVIYWGYTRLESSDESEALKGTLPNVGRSICKGVVFDAGGVQVSYQKDGTVRTEGAMSSVFLLNAPIDDPDRGGVIEVCGNAKRIQGQTWKVSSLFSRVSDDGKICGIKGASLKPKFVFLIYPAWLEHSGDLSTVDISKLRWGNPYNAPSDATRVRGPSEKDDIGRESGSARAPG